MTLGFASRVDAQDTIVAFGKIISGGTLAASTSPTGVIAGSISNATGSYNLSLFKTGAFTGTTAGDYVVETSISSVNHGDSICNASVVSISNDILTIRIRIMDLEDSAFPALAAAVDSDIMFVVRRIDGIASGTAIGSRHLVAAGNVRSSGDLDSGFGVDGVSVQTGRGGVGEYSVLLSKTGAFATDSHNDYVMIVSPRNVGTPDVAVRGGSYYLISDDTATFYVRSDDVQSATPSNTPVAADTAFAFAIYRMGSQDAAGSPSSNLIAAIASVDGATGTLEAGRAAFPGAVVSSTRSSEGRYDIFIDAPGAFAGKDPAQYVSLVTLNSIGQIDKLAKTRVAIENAGRLRIDVNVDDVEHDTSDVGTPDDMSFFVTVYDAAPLLSHDLRVGPKSSGAKAKGGGIFNSSGAGQSIKLAMPGVAKRRAFYRSVNSGPSVDSLRLKTGKISRSLKATFLLTSPLRSNVTAAAKSGGLVTEGLRPGDSVGLQATIRYRKLSTRPKSSILLRTISALQPSRQDTTKVFLQPD